MAGQGKTNSTGVLEHTAPNGEVPGDKDALSKELAAPLVADPDSVDGGDESEGQPAALSVEYKASIHQAGVILPELGEALRDLGTALGGMPVWLLIQNGQTVYAANSVSEEIADRLFLQRGELQADQPVAVVIDSLGGDARGAHRIAELLRKQCGGFVAVVPRVAKSAATLLAFGAHQIVLGEFAELGPLDVQIWSDPEEPPESALNEVEAVQRLHTDALSAVDRAMWLLPARMGKKIETVLPYAIQLVTQTMRPLLEKVDTKQYTKRSRELKIGEDYATRLLSARYPWPAASVIAQSFVHDYADHNFIIDQQETARILSRAEHATEGRVPGPLAPLTVPLTPELCHILNRLLPLMEGLTAVGLLGEAEVANDPSAQA